MKNSYVIDIHIKDMEKPDELEVPSDITILDLIEGLSGIYHIPVDHNKLDQYYLKMDYPKSLLRGEKLLRDTGMRDGSEVWLWNE